MFKRISYIIALQFTAFVFGLVLLAGLLFLAADFAVSRRQSADRLRQDADAVLNLGVISEDGELRGIPPHIRERVRVVDKDGKVLYAGALLEDLEFRAEPMYSRFLFRGDEVSLLTRGVQRDGQLVGYIQVGETERQQFAELPGRGFRFLLVSGGISALTFGVGLFFARRSLKPAEQMMIKLEQFTQDASHELRTPLAALRSSLDLALKTGKYQEGILSAKEDLADISILVDQLLELARLEQAAMQVESVDLSALASESVDRHLALAGEKGVTLTGTITEKVTVPGNATLLRRLLGNLLSNALKFTPAGGTVTVTLTEKKLSVSDTGIGIASDMLERIFDRFFQADDARSQEGFGLGLALVKRITDLHGWSLDVKSKQGKGTTFSVSFG